MFSKTILTNGIRVVSVPMPQVKSVAVLVLVKTGSRYETKETNGISHFLEHMAFKGTKSRPSSLAITSLIDGIGGSFNAFTGKDHTGFYIKAASEHLDLITDVLSDMILNSLIDPAEMEKEKGVIIEEINQTEDQPSYRVMELYEELLFGDCPMGWRISGTKETVAKISRQQVLNYIKNKYVGKNMVIGIGGGIQKDGNSGIQDFFEKINAGTENNFEKYKNNQEAPKASVHYKRTDQAHLCLGVRGYNISHPDRYVLALLTTILGGNMSSRLFLEIREKRGLAYHISAASEEFADIGYFVTQAGLRINAVEDAIKVILDEFNKLRANPPTLDELRRAKDFWRGKMVLGLEDSFRNAAFYANQELLENKIETPEEVLARVDAVTGEDIQRVAKNIFLNNNLNLAIIGPFKEKEWKELSF
jgi:predicted Zn-dependent peptidase